MDITIIPNFPVTLFSLHHKNITSLSTVKLYFQKKIIQNIFWIYANENQSAKYTPLTLKTNYKNCSLCRRTIYVSLLHIILLSLSLLLNCLSGACALTSSQKASHTHRPVLSHHTVRENTQSQWLQCWQSDCTPASTGCTRSFDNRSGLLWACCKQPWASLSHAPKQSEAM